MIGLCGNSGNSSEPHIHFHLQHTPVLQDGRGIKCLFERVKVVRDGKTEERKGYAPVKGDIISRMATSDRMCTAWPNSRASSPSGTPNIVREMISIVRSVIACSNSISKPEAPAFAAINRGPGRGFDGVVERFKLPGVGQAVGRHANAGVGRHDRLNESMLTLVHRWPPLR